jgi:hypothetical protein
MFSPKVREKLGSYVYLYIDPRTGKAFYIGKGKGNRLFTHLNNRSDSAKARIIRKLRRLGLKPQIEILKYGLTEKEALLVEQTAIDLLDIGELTNAVRGHGSRHGSRGTVRDIEAELEAKPVDVREPAILIKLSRAYRPGMSSQELYDATRSAWKLGSRREKAKYALSVFHGIAREVYAIAEWVPGGSTMRSTDTDGRHARIRGRQEFVGQVAPEAIRRRYVGRSVAHHFTRGAQNPIAYVNC